METNIDPWKTHDWCDRRSLEIDFHKRGILVVCRKCNRGFAQYVTGNRYAIEISAFTIYRLPDEVTSRWLSEPCPLEQREGDSEDRASRLLNGWSRNESASKSR
jgi:hypothetical protein